MRNCYTRSPHHVAATTHHGPPIARQNPPPNETSSYSYLASTAQLPLLPSLSHAAARLGWHPPRNWQSNAPIFRRRHFVLDEALSVVATRASRHNASTAIRQRRRRRRRRRRTKRQSAVIATHIKSKMATVSSGKTDDVISVYINILEIQNDDSLAELRLWDTRWRKLKTVKNID